MRAVRSVRPSDGVRRSLLVALLITLVGAGAVLGSAPASAHAVLIGVKPADGTSTATAPTRVTALFDDNIRTPSVVIVTGPDGTRVDHGSTAVTDNTASVPVTLTESGRYTMSFRVVSADGHPVAGQSTFTFTGGTKPSASASASGDQSTARSADRPTSTSGGTSPGLVVGGVLLVVVVGGALLLAARLRQPRLREDGAAASDDPARDQQ